MFEKDTVRMGAWLIGLDKTPDPLERSQPYQMIEKFFQEKRFPKTSPWDSIWSAVMRATKSQTTVDRFKAIAEAKRVLEKIENSSHETVAKFWARVHAFIEGSSAPH